MTKAKELLSKHPYPTFIKNHKVFDNFKEIKKVFPEIGLPNSEETLEIDNRKEAEASAKALVQTLKQSIDDRLSKLEKYPNKNPKIGDKRKLKWESSKKLLTEVKKQLGNKCIKTNNGKITLNLSEDIVSDGAVVFKSGEGIFKVYNKLNETLREGKFLAMDKLDNNYAFKDFSSKNVPTLKYNVRFSSDGEEGLWDIATMSMRGIQSCQTWDTGGHSTHVVGSMVDPFTAIMYLTSGAKHGEYGSKMIRRCIIRFVVDEKTHTPLIGIERMYPAIETGTLNSFKEFIKKRIDNKFDVVYLPDSKKAAYVPVSKIINSLQEQYKPYRDSGMAYVASPVDKKALAKEEITRYAYSISSAVWSRVSTALRSIKLSEIPEGSKKTFQSLRGSDYYHDKSYYLSREISSRIQKEFTKKIKDVEDSEQFIQDQIKTVSESFDKTMSDSLKAINKSFSKEEKLNKDILEKISTMSSNKLKDFWKQELKKSQDIQSKKNKDSVNFESMTALYKDFLC